MFTTEQIQSRCRKAIAEGTVLLENDGMLPLKTTDKVAVLGRAQFEYTKSGTGSGGDVVCPYISDIGNELKKRVRTDCRAEEFYRRWIEKLPRDMGDNWDVPQYQPEPVPDEKLITELARDNDKAIVVIARICGENFDFKPQKGGYFLTDEEEQTIALAVKHFKHVCVILNSGNIIDMRWIKKFNVRTVVYVWQGGQEGGAGVVQALLGEYPVCGRLSDTIAENLDDYPAYGNFGNGVKNIHREDIYVGYRFFETFAKNKVLYPFGYGLSYTRFDYENIRAERTGNEIEINVSVKNTGSYAGKDVVQCYVKKPQGTLGNPSRELVAFKKTKLLSVGESEVVGLKINIDDLVSYDDSGKSGFAYAYVLEKGTYEFYLGKDVRSAEKVFEFLMEETLCVRQCVQALAPTEEFDRLVNGNGNVPVYEKVPLRKYDLKKRIKDGLPKEIALTGDRNIKLQDVASGANSIDEFIAQFSAQRLCELVSGEGPSSHKAPVDGTAGCFGGLNDNWHEYGVPTVTVSDGPVGVRLANSDVHTTCIPSGILLACTWSPETLSEVYEIVAAELKNLKIDILLAPGINIHRYPLCGRSFEYFSEDPYLTGKCAVAFSKCFKENGVECTLKHFAVNSQEFERGSENEILSERAAREIYLKAFQMAVESGYVKYIMSSYNRINGISSSANYDLNTTILRGEWNYQGVVMTDWWTIIDDIFNNSYSKNNLAAMVRAQNDIYMVMPDAAAYNDDLSVALLNGNLTLAEVQRTARNILVNIIDSLSFKLFDKNKTIDLIAEDKPLFVFGEGKEYSLNDITAGKYIIKMEYSVSSGLLVQNEEAIVINGQKYKTELLKGTEGERNIHYTVVELPESVRLSFSGSAHIYGIAIFNVKK